jgi:hypothetical protein
MNFASSHIFLTVKTKFGTNWKSQRDVARSDWPTPLHADRPRWLLDLNEICGLDQSWELTQKKQRAAAPHRRRSPSAVRRRPSATGNGGRWEACDGDHGGGLRRLSGVPVWQQSADGSTDGAQTPASNFSLLRLCEGKRRG